mgnify:CR=1 FL=1
MNATKSDTPFFHLFAQHGWADGNKDMVILANRLTRNKHPYSAPDLGYVPTWLRIEPLIQRVEAIAIQTAAAYPHRPWRIVGHSMGGLIWLEVLHRHPEWWSRVHSLVLVASPVGGADLGRLLDPLGWGIGIATDLGTNRRAMAESIAARIPTLVIAGDIDGGRDGTIPVMSTFVSHARFVCLPDIDHARLKTHPEVVRLIHQFWRDDSVGAAIAPDFVIQQVRAIPGITDSHPRNLEQARIWHTFEDGRTLRLWKNDFGIHYVYLVSTRDVCLYAGFVGWLHTLELWKVLVLLKQGDRPFGAAPTVD